MKRYKGMLTVEAAIVFPLLLLITFGVIEYGWLFLKAQQITNAARHGARLAVLPNTTTTEVETAIANLMSQANITAYALTITPDDVGFPEPGEPIKVTMTVNTEDIAVIKYALLPLPPQLGASVTMAKEGPG